MEMNPEQDAEPGATAPADEAATPTADATIVSEPEPAAPEAMAEPGREASDADDAGDRDETPEGGDSSAETTAPADDPLSLLVAEAQQRRLSPGDEEKASKLLQETLLNGREGVGRAIEVLPKLAWVIGVNAVTAVWQEMKPTFRTRLLAGLARVDTEAARRVRLSIARGIFKQDVPAALKIAVSVAKDMRVKEAPGTIAVKNAQIFANVFIGRAKPWVTQLPLADLKPAEADLLVQTGVLAVFTVPHPPATQLGMLKWAAEGGRLERLTEATTAAVVKGVDRWNGKWRSALRREVAELPEIIVTALRLEAAPPAPAPAPASAESLAEGEADEETKGEREAGEAEGGSGEESDEDEDDEEEDEDEDDDEENEGEEKPATRQQPRPRPVYESKTMPSRGERDRERDRDRDRSRGEGRGERAFNLPESLRQIEQYVNGLRNELAQAQNRLRQREETRRPPVERAAPIAGAPTPDELARLNQQLEARNVELQARLDEMREDAEMRAASGAAPAESDVPPVDPGEQLRSLLGLKLQEDFADFLALEQEAPDQVIKQHYPVLLRHVFDVLRHEGVRLAEPVAEGEGNRPAPPA